MMHPRRIMGTATGFVAFVMLSLLVVLAVVGPIVWGSSARAVNVSALSQGSSAGHLFGTDYLGRDVFARVLVAERLSVCLAFAATAVAMALGVSIGSLQGVLGARARTALGNAVNVALAFPTLLIGIFIAVIFGLSTFGAVLAIGIALTPQFARLTLTLTASVMAQDYVKAAKLLRMPRRHLIARHVLPNVAEPLLLNGTMAVSSALLSLASLSFLGIGVQPPSYDWGRLLNEALPRIYLSPAAALAPGAAIVIAGIAFNLLGEAMAAVVSRRGGRRAARRSMPSRHGDTAISADRAGEDDVLSVRNLRVFANAPDGASEIVHGIDLTVRRKEVVGIVGESGSGKTLATLALARLLPGGVEATADQLVFDGRDLQRAGPGGLRALATSLPLIMQDPLTSLNPALRIGTQVAEGWQVHHGATRQAAWQRAADRLRRVGLPAAERVSRQYPHELSGGMRQRAVIAMSLMGEPKLVIADEPTTALDVTVQRQVLDELHGMCQRTGSAMLFVSHDVAAVADLCSRVVVMYAGRIVENLTVQALRGGGSHPYTRALVTALPDVESDPGIPLGVISGEPANAGEVVPGCAYAPRCPRASERCVGERPKLVAQQADVASACWHPLPLFPDGVGERRIVREGSR